VGKRKLKCKRSNRLFVTLDYERDAAATGLPVEQVRQAARHLIRHGWLIPTGTPGRVGITAGEDCPGPGRCPLWEPE
jgi:hypothetical protein